MLIVIESLVIVVVDISGVDKVIPSNVKAASPFNVLAIPVAVTK